MIIELVAFAAVVRENNMDGENLIQILLIG